ncbi:MAG: UpxY family transcription antiterminator [Chitinophagaceae bacterium]|nr:UpxY family transcription antiterminator [Chitinophagaceae bacterium]
MIANDKKTWYILYTQPRAEKKVAEVLGKRNIEYYMPVIYSKQTNEKKKHFSENLFASYVFVHVSSAQLHSFKCISGMINFVYWLGSPAVVKNEEINAIKQFLAEYPQAWLEKTTVKTEDMVRISQGASIQKQGKIVQVAGNSVKLELPSLGYALIAQSNVFKAGTPEKYYLGEIAVNK